MDRGRRAQAIRIKESVWRLETKRGALIGRCRLQRQSPIWLVLSREMSQAERNLNITQSTRRRHGDHGENRVPPSLDASRRPGAMEMLALATCRERHFFKSACQLSTTVNFGCALGPVEEGATIRKRLPSAETFQKSTPGATLNSALGIPA